jgi:predicted protein tyrosine phosphatase
MPRVLFICSRNRLCSPTAEKVPKGLPNSPDVAYLAITLSQ